jgi:lysophospholipase L1-like esterase
LPLVDLVEVFGLEPDPAYYLPDGLHPNPAGQEIMFDAVLAALPW